MLTHDKTEGILVGMKGYLTVRDFAKRFKITRQCVVDRIRRGTLKAHRAGRVWLIAENEADQFSKMRFGSRIYLVKLDAA